VKFACERWSLRRVGIVPFVGWQVGLLHGGRGELIAAFIVINPGVPLHPNHLNFMPLVGGQKSSQQIRILRLFRSGEPHRPTMGTPPESGAARDGIHDVLGIAMQPDSAAFFQSFQTRDHRHQFHAIIRGQRKPTGQLLHVVAEAKDDPVATSTRIGDGAPIGVNGNFFQIGRRFRSL
jgi:hypothetical protein